ncbi:phosphate regulon sensor histidine kinase PhoR [Thalassotalea sp. M1531]|uniref:Phosphate regulon sensor protein PhoR n=1 Tax=Thalassotalea algicola TaxID=2716224 RepID=A0A7Y0LBA3_9GAMM|nr:phosphate regulon sensor histidine kinase PhoR [Thalassotalea algicola]NMP30987.1 phosphate regulon sensor histidine kinase PhoR [Thalassotalea algicola]
MPIRLSISQVISRLIIVFSLSALLGYLIGHILLMMLLAAVGVIAYQYKHIFMLSSWLWETKAISPPEGEGSWGRIFDGLDRLVKKHRKKQKQLNDRIRRFRDGAEAIPDAGIVLGRDLSIQWSNKRANRLLGLRWPTDQGQRIDNLLRAPEFSEYLERADYDLPCVLASPINANIQLELRFMDYGKENILLLARDVSKVHRVEAMRRDFVANVSHELKTPLTVVRGYVEMIQASEGDFDPHWQQAFDTIEGQVSRMDRLVEQLLVLSRVEVNTENDVKQPLNVPEILSNLLNDAHWLNQEKQHEISADIDESIGVLGVDTELKSAFANLISNAVAYTPANGKITVSWQRFGLKAKFTVKDNGTGIRPEDVNRLTERFYRVDKSRSRNTGGSGLGLAIVKHVLHHHNAELIINSQWQKGSEFSIVFEESSVITLN